MAFRKTGLCRLITLVLTLCMLACAASAALSESEPITEAQIEEASNKAYEEAMLQGETEVAFSVVATLGQYLSDLMVCVYGEIPVSETDSANAAAQLVDEVIRRADLCFRSEEAGIAAEKLAVFDRAKEEWQTAAAQFGPEGVKFEAGLPLVDDRVIDPATDAFNRIPAEAQPVYLEQAESVYRTIWQILRTAVAAKAGDALGVPEIAELAGSDTVSELEDTAAQIIAGAKSFLSGLSEGFGVEKSEERARIEQVGSRLNSLEAVVKMMINALGIEPVSRLLKPSSRLQPERQSASRLHIQSCR